MNWRALPAAADAFFAEDFDTAMVWAGEAVDLIHEVAPAAQIVERIGAEAEEHLRASAARCGAGPGKPRSTRWGGASRPICWRRAAPAR